MKRIVGIVGKIGTVCLFAYSVYQFLAVWSVFAFSNTDLFDPYDSAFRLLAHAYVAHGLVPYRDFWYPYGPGLIILVGKIIPFVSMVQQNFVVAMVTIILTVVMGGVYWLLLPHGKHKFIAVSLFILLNAVFLDELAWSEPISRLLIVFLIILGYAYMKNGKKIVLLLGFLISFFSVFFRWSHIVSLVGVEVFLAGGIWLYEVKMARNVSKELRRYWKYIICEIVGISAGFVGLFVYLNAIHAVREGVEDIFVTPTRVFGPLRSLPLPPFSLLSGSGGLLYLTFILWLAAVAVIAFRLRHGIRESKRLWAICILLLPLFILPYVFFRADLAHIEYLFYFVGISLLIGYASIPKSSVLLALGVLLFIPLRDRIYPISFTTPQTTPLLEAYLISTLSDCKRVAFDTGMTYQTMFVGRLSYVSYTFNFTELYLLDTALPPATRYIGDEPGIQSSVVYGDVIAHQLKAAKKPMLVFLEIPPQIPDSNEIQLLQSSGKIEDFLKNNEYKTLGVCKLDHVPIAVRVYH